MTSDALLAAKTALRKSAAQLRAVCHAGYAETASEGLREQGVPLLDPRSFEVLSGFWPIRTEIDPWPLIRALAHTGRRVGLPAVVGRGALQFRAWHAESEMVSGPLGTTHPDTDEILEPDVLLVPLLAFDRRRHRLGYGAGHYDATLARLRAIKPILAVGVAFAAQEVDEVPIDPWDQPLDMILTEQGAI